MHFPILDSIHVYRLKSKGFSLKCCTSSLFRYLVLGLSILTFSVRLFPNVTFV